MKKADTIETSSKERSVWGTAKVVRDVCREREVSAEDVLAAIFDTLAEDYLNQLPRDESAIETPYGQQVGAMPVMTALTFRRLMQRMCAVNLKAAERVDDPALTPEEWSAAEGALAAGVPQAAACDLFDGVIQELAEQIRVEKEEAEILGKPDPHPQVQFAEGSTTEALIVEPPAIGFSGAMAARPGEKTMWN